MAINDLHDDLFAASGGRWDRPPPRVDWAPRHIARAAEIISEYPRDRRWGFKDPKTLQALQGWKALLGEMIYIGIYRHPIAVARSLEHRSRIPLDHGLELWRNYNERLIAEHDRNPFPILSFDWSEEEFHEKLNRVLPEIGLEPLGRAEEDRFFTPDLRHQEVPQESTSQGLLPPEVERLYRDLEERVI